MSAVMEAPVFKQREAKFIPPPVSLCEVVIWRDTNDPHSSGIPGIVAEVGGSTIKICLLDAASGQQRWVDSARHIADPRAMEANFRDQGTWDHSDEKKRASELEAKVESQARTIFKLAEEVATITALLEKPS